MQFKSKKVMVKLDRGMTDKPSLVVWEHEVPILEALHGSGNVVRIEPESLAEKGVTCEVIKGTLQAVAPEDKDASFVNNKGETVHKYKGAKFETILLCDLRARQLGIGQEFTGDLREEYARLQNVYGMHPEVKQLAVEYVYGRYASAGFRRAMVDGTFTLSTDDDDFVEVHERQVEARA